MAQHVGRFVGFNVEKVAGPLPYLVERLMPAVYRRKEAPSHLERNDLIAWASNRSMDTRFRTCLVFNPEDCVYLEPNGSWYES